jgi:hypothetical protein
VAPAAADALDVLATPGRDPQSAVVLERDPGPPPPPRTAARGLARRLRDGVKDWLGLLADPRAGTVPDGTDGTDGPALPPTGPSPTEGGTDQAAAGTVAWEADEAERLVLRTSSAQAAVLVVRDTYFPGWSATIDGQPAPVLRADYLFRAVAVPAGAHTVELRYESRALGAGAIVSLLSVLLTLGLGALRLERRRRPENPPADGSAGEAPAW